MKMSSYTRLHCNWLRTKTRCNVWLPVYIGYQFGPALFSVLIDAWYFILDISFKQLFTAYSTTLKGILFTFKCLHLDVNICFCISFFLKKLSDFFFYSLVRLVYLSRKKSEELINLVTCLYTTRSRGYIMGSFHFFAFLSFNQQKGSTGCEILTFLAYQLRRRMSYDILLEDRGWQLEPPSYKFKIKDGSRAWRTSLLQEWIVKKINALFQASLQVSTSEHFICST